MTKSSRGDVFAWARVGLTEKLKAALEAEPERLSERDAAGEPGSTGLGRLANGHFSKISGALQGAPFSTRE